MRIATIDLIDGLLHIQTPCGSFVALDVNVSAEGGGIIQPSIPIGAEAGAQPGEHRTLRTLDDPPASGKPRTFDLGS